MVRLTRERRRQQILDTAIELFAKRGFRGTTTKQLAQAADVSEATIFLHFPSKDSLYAAILEEKLKTERPLTALLDDAGDVPLADMLLSIADTLVKRHHRDRALLRLMLFSALERHTLAGKLFRQHLEGPARALTNAIARAAERGEVRADLEPEVAARAFASMLIHQILSREVFGQDHVRPSDLRDYVDIYLRGVVPRTT